MIESVHIYIYININIVNIKNIYQILSNTVSLKIIIKGFIQNVVFVKRNIYIYCIFICIQILYVYKTCICVYVIYVSAPSTRLFVDVPGAIAQLILFGQLIK